MQIRCFVEVQLLRLRAQSIGWPKAQLSDVFPRLNASFFHVVSRFIRLVCDERKDRCSPCLLTGERSGQIYCGLTIENTCMTSLSLFICVHIYVVVAVRFAALLRGPGPHPVELVDD